jgi:hypothetical protein
MVELLVLTSLVLLAFTSKIVITFVTKQTTFMRRLSVLSLSLKLVFYDFTYLGSLGMIASIDLQCQRSQGKHKACRNLWVPLCQCKHNPREHSKCEKFWECAPCVCSIKHLGLVMYGKWTNPILGCCFITADNHFNWLQTNTLPY